MGRRSRVQYSLNTGAIKSLSEEEIKMILRGADELICTGGRSMLVKILKGSKDKKVLEYKLDQCPAYGFYRSLTQEEISCRVDWMIKRGYLRIEYSGRLPMLVFSENGWEIERETYTEELFQRFDLDRRESNFRVIHEMKDVNRQVVMGILEKIRATREEGFAQILEVWKAMEVRKVRERIESVEKTLKSKESGPVIVWLRAEKYEAKRIAKLVERTIGEIYPKYYPDEVTNFFYILHSEARIEADIESKRVGILLCDGRMVGTGSVKGNHITRVYVLPDEQGKGFGSRIVEELEKIIGRKYDSVELDASAPAEEFYEKRGYKTVKIETLNLGEEKMEYKVMEKVLATS